MRIEDAIRAAVEAHRGGLVVGYTAGVFDLFHQGHQRYLTRCASECGFLIVGVDVDAVVKRNRSADRPDQAIHARLGNVSQFPGVSKAFAKESSADAFLSAMAPDIYFVPDNRHLRQSRLRLLRETGTSLTVLPYLQGISTTRLLEERALGEAGCDRSSAEV